MGELESMTGHGSGRVERGAFAVDVVLRSVNHRHLDLRSRADDVAVDFLPAAEARVRAKVGRGRVDLRVCVEGRLRAAPTLDVARAEGALEQLRALRDRLAPEEPVPLTLLQSVPGLFREAGIEDRAALEAAITEATDEAIESFRAMRACEGKALATELMRLTGSLRDCVERLREEAPALVQRAVVRLRARVEALLEQAPDERRMAQEIALLAERSDVLEELARLDSHLQQ
ncbi:MAG: YicC/YloC family endoribonuclease, partial [Myxococcota bacterium]